MQEHAENECVRIKGKVKNLSVCEAITLKLSSIQLYYQIVPSCPFDPEM